MKKISRIFAALIAILMLIALVACSTEGKSGKYDYSADYPSDYGYDNEDAKSYSATPNQGNTAPVQPNNIRREENELKDRLLIRTISMSGRTLAFDAAMAGIESFVTEAGGYFETLNITTGSKYYYSGDANNVRTATLVVRVPKDDANAFVKTVENLITVTSHSENNTDITEAYSDTQSHLTALYAQEDRLVELVAEAKNLTELLELEDKLAEVRYAIKNYEKTLNGYDNKISYTTINLTIYELEKEVVEDQDTLWTRMRYAFKDSMSSLGNFGEGLLVWLTGALPILVVLAAVTIIVIIIIKGSIKKRRAKKNASQD